MWKYELGILIQQGWYISTCFLWGFFTYYLVTAFCRGNTHEVTDILTDPTANEPTWRWMLIHHRINCTIGTLICSTGVFLTSIGPTSIECIKWGGVMVSGQCYDKSAVESANKQYKEGTNGHKEILRDGFIKTY